MPISFQVVVSGVVETVTSIGERGINFPTTIRSNSTETSGGAEEDVKLTLHSPIWLYITYRCTSSECGWKFYIAVIQMLCLSNNFLPAFTSLILSQVLFKYLPTTPSTWQINKLLPKYWAKSGRSLPPSNSSVWNSCSKSGQVGHAQRIILLI